MLAEKNCKIYMLRLHLKFLPQTGYSSLFLDWTDFNFCEKTDTVVVFLLPHPNGNIVRTLYILPTPYFRNMKTGSNLKLITSDNKQRHYNYVLKLCYKT